MSFKCPHCGEDLAVMKSVDLTSAKPVAQPEGDLVGGIVKATTDAIVTKVAETSGSNAVMNSLETLNNLANGNLGDSASGLAAGWGGAMVESLKSRDEQISSPGYSPEQLARQDPEMINKEAAAKTLQNMIHGSLSKG